MVDEGALKKLVQTSRDSSIETLLPEELNVLIDSFLPSEGSALRAQSLLFLSKFSSDIRKKYSSQSDPDVAISVLVRTYAAPVEARLADTHETASVAALSFLTALFQVDWESACEVFARDGLLEAVMESPELYPGSRSVAVAVAGLLAQACGHKGCRPLVAAPQVKAWLDRSVRRAEDAALRAAAAVALVKLSRGSDMDQKNANLGESSALSSSMRPEPTQTGTDDGLVELMKNLVMTEEQPSAATVDAVEGLVYLSAESDVKEALSTDAAFLRHLVALVASGPSVSFPASHADRFTDAASATDPDLGLDYGVAVIIANLCEYKPRLSDEEEQIERLRRMTKVPAPGGKLAADGSATDRLADDEHVRSRAKRLVECGAVGALAGIVKKLRSGEAERRNVAVQRSVAKAFLSLVEDKGNRGRVLQGGGAKALLTIIRASLTGLSLDVKGEKGLDAVDTADLLAIQALTKLSITSSPAAVFGPAQDTYVDAIRPFAILLLHPSASLLQQFEAVMALTNIASVDPEAAERVSSFAFLSNDSSEGRVVGDIIKRAEMLLLDSNTMLRRACTELVCNVVGGAEESLNYFGAKTRLHILVALSDVEDMPTRLAASGALAILTSSEQACQNLAKLELERHRVIPVLVELISPQIAREHREERPEDEESEEEGEDGAGDPGLVHRGVVCVRNLFANLDAKEERRAMSVEAEKRGLVRALVQTIKVSPGGPENAAVLRPAGEVLKWIVQSGVKLPV